MFSVNCAHSKLRAFSLPQTDAYLLFYDHPKFRYFLFCSDFTKKSRRPPNFQGRFNYDAGGSWAIPDQFWNAQVMYFTGMHQLGHISMVTSKPHFGGGSVVKKLGSLSKCWKKKGKKKGDRQKWIFLQSFHNDAAAVYALVSQPQGWRRRSCPTRAFSSRVSRGGCR